VLLRREGWKLTDPLISQGRTLEIRDRGDHAVTS
jgi:hypothetical protein